VYKIVRTSIGSTRMKMTTTNREARGVAGFVAESGHPPRSHKRSNQRHNW
jgi:hypothetical protein